MKINYKTKREFGNTIYDDGTIAMKEKYIFEDSASMMLFYKERVANRVRGDRTTSEVNRSELTITCTYWTQAMKFYDELAGEEE